jgi:hypothetical protein
VGYTCCCTCFHTITVYYTLSCNLYTHIHHGSSSRRIEKFSGRPGTISLREFKATFSTVVCELELKYGVDYTEAFAFKQLSRYVHYEALDVYE